MTIRNYKECDECHGRQSLPAKEIGGHNRWFELSATGFTDEPFEGKHHYCSLECLAKTVNKYNNLRITNET